MGDGRYWCLAVVLAPLFFRRGFNFASVEVNRRILALLVTEPTPFGRHDLGLALEMVELLGIPHGVVINRAGDDNSTVSELCQEKNVPIMLEIEFSSRLASLGAAGIPFSKVLPYWQERFYETYLTGIDLALIVSEPSVSGRHDLERIHQVTQHFGVHALVCINKWDLSPEMSKDIEKYCEDEGVNLVGKIPFDPEVMDVYRQGLPVERLLKTKAGEAIAEIWDKVRVSITI